MSEWISIGKQLPDDKQNCICCSVNHGTNVFVARYIGGRQFHDFWKNWVAVTHWMPLPALPEGRDKEK